MKKSTPFVVVAIFSIAIGLNTTTCVERLLEIKLVITKSDNTSELSARILSIEARAASVAAWRPVSRACSGTVRYGGGMGRAAPARSEAAASSQEPFASAVTLAAAASMCKGAAKAAYPKSTVKGV